MNTAFTYEVLASPLHDPDQLRRSMAPIVESLESLGGCSGEARDNANTPYVLAVATGGTEAQILSSVRRRSSLNDEPTILLARETDNSLPSALEALARLQQEGGRGRIVMTSAAGELARAVSDQAAYLALRRLRLGVVGYPSDWLIASSPSDIAVRDRWGPSLVHLETDSLVISGQEQHEDGVAVTLGQRWVDAAASGSVALMDVERAARIHQPLVDLIADNELDGVTVRCFDLLGPAATSGCVALAELNDSGVVAGCEGDLVSAVAMLWVRQLLGAVSWMANPATVDSETGEILLAHCTVAPSMVASYDLETHFESGLGVGIAGQFLDQPVTLIRLGGRDLERAWIVDGDLVSGGRSSHLCRTQVTVTVEPSKAAEMLERPLGNHVILIAGHHARRLQAWWKLYIAD